MRSSGSSVAVIFSAHRIVYISYFSLGNPWVWRLSGTSDTVHIISALLLVAKIVFVCRCCVVLRDPCRRVVTRAMTSRSSGLRQARGRCWAFLGGLGCRRHMIGPATVSDIQRDRFCRVYSERRPRRDELAVVRIAASSRPCNSHCDNNKCLRFGIWQVRQ